MPKTPPGPATIYPMAFLVEQDADAVVGAHYHQADQFQVMVGGSGRLGTHDVAAGAVHFAGAWSPYGPLAAGGDGLHYFTLRNGWDPGARYMEFPDNRATLRALPRRHREWSAISRAAPRMDCARTATTLPREARMTGPDPASGARAVLAGTGRLDAVRRRGPPAAVVCLRVSRRGTVHRPGRHRWAAGPGVAVSTSAMTA